MKSVSMIHALYDVMLKGLWFVEAPGGALIIYPREYYDEGRLFTKHGMSTVLNSAESIERVLANKRALANLTPIPLGHVLDICYGERKLGSKVIFERQVSVYDAQDLDQKIISILIEITLKYRKYVFGRELFDVKFYNSWGTLVSASTRSKIAVQINGFEGVRPRAKKITPRTFTEEQLNEVLSKFSQKGNRISTTVLVRELYRPQ